jgi:hypothetical protein
VGGQCGVPLDATAVSFNFTAARTASTGYLLVYPAKGSRPGTSTLNYSAGQALANGAIVSLGAGGAVTAEIYGGAADLVIDVNGYFGGSLVTSLNGMSGAVSLLAGANVTITPSAGTLTVSAASTPGPAGPSGPTGPAGPTGPTGPSSGGRHHFQSIHELNGAIGALYLSPLTSFTNSVELGSAVALVPAACTMTSLRVFVTSPVGVSVAEAFTLRTGTSMLAIDESTAVSDLADTVLTCTIFQGGQTCFATGALALPAGQLFDFKVDVLGGFAPDTHDAVVSVVCE